MSTTGASGTWTPKICAKVPDLSDNQRYPKAMIQAANALES